MKSCIVAILSALVCLADPAAAWAQDLDPFLLMDGDQDDLLSFEEFHAIYPQFDRIFFGSLDLDQDGGLSWEDWQGFSSLSSGDFVLSVPNLLSPPRKPEMTVTPGPVQPQGLEPSGPAAAFMPSPPVAVQPPGAVNPQIRQIPQVSGPSVGGPKAPGAPQISVPRVPVPQAPVLGQADEEVKVF